MGRGMDIFGIFKLSNYQVTPYLRFCHFPVILCQQGTEDSMCKELKKKQWEKKPLWVQMCDKDLLDWMKRGPEFLPSGAY